MNLCSECKHYRLVLLQGRLCQRLPLSIDPTDGRPRFSHLSCHAERDTPTKRFAIFDTGACGPEGRFFSPKAP